MNVTTGNSVINTGTFQICEDDTPTGNKCNCVAGTELNITYQGDKAINIPESTNTITDTMSYTSSVNKKYWFRFGGNSGLEVGTASWDTPSQSDIMFTGTDNTAFGNLSWQATTSRNWIYLLWSVIAENSSDFTAPLINISLNDTSLVQGNSINITGNSSDETALSFCQIILNQTGINVYYNFSLSGTSGFCSQNITIANLNGIINFTTLVNDTSNNKAQSSTIITVGDVTNPVLNNCTISATSITDASGNTINLTCEATDNESNIQTMVAYLNGTINKTLPFSFTQATTIKPTYVIFQSSETLLVGSYSISQVNVTDISSNKLINATNDLHFSVTSAPSPSPAPAGGGGGGGGTLQTKSENTTFNLLTENFGDEYESINVNSNSVKEIKILIENLGNKTTIINFKCIESTSLTTTISLCNNVQFSQESLNLVPSTFPLETLIKVRIPEAELFKTFSLIVQGTSTEGGVDNLRMSFIIFPRATDFFRLLKQLAIGITRFHIGDSSIPFPNIASFLFLEGIILVIFIRRQFAGKWIVLTLLSLIVLIVTTALSFEICKLSFAECLIL